MAVNLAAQRYLCAVAALRSPHSPRSLQASLLSRWPVRAQRPGRVELLVAELLVHGRPSLHAPMIWQTLALYLWIYYHQ